MIFFLPLPDDDARAHGSLVTYLLLVALVVIHLSGDVFRHPVLAPFLSVHGVALAIDLYFLWLVGGRVEDKLGHVGFTAFFVLGGAAGAIVDRLATGAALSPSAGGAIGALVAAYMVFFPSSKIRVAYMTLLPQFRADTLRIDALFAGGGWFAYQLIYWAIATQVASGVPTTHSTHVGGFVTGLAMAWVLSLFGVKHPEAGSYPVDTLRPADRRDRMSKRAAPAIEPPDVEGAIRRALADGRKERATDLYLALRVTGGGRLLMADLQIAIADTLHELGLYRDAAGAYRAYVDGYHDGPDRVRAQVRLATIHAKHLASYDGALAAIRQTPVRLLDEGTRWRLEAIERRILAHLDRIVPAGETLGGPATLLRQTSEPVYEPRYARIVSEVTGEPIRDVVDRLERTRGFVAHRVPSDRAEALARRLQIEGLPVLVVGEDHLVGLPPLRAATSLYADEKGVALDVLGEGRIERAWADVFLVVGAWLHSEPKTVGPPTTAEVARIAADPSRHDLRQPIPGLTIEEKAWRDLGQRPTLDVFLLGPWARVRVFQNDLATRKRPLKKLRRMARIILRRGRQAAMSEGVYALARGASRERYTFKTADDLDRYEAWLLQLEEFNRSLESMPSHPAR